MATSGKFSRAKPLGKNQNPENICNISMGQTEKKEYVKVYDKDGTRKLIVPARKPIDIPGTWPQSEFKRLQQQAHVVTKKERMAMLEEADQKKNALVLASEQRKELLERARLIQHAKVGTKLSDVEREAKRKNLYLLERSFELIQEQDDRVKAANRLILATKCRAIRNAQILEKELIEKQLREEEFRLDQMMEQQRQKALLDEEERRKAEAIKTEKFTAQLTQQMKMNETERLIEAERNEEEAKNLNKAFIALQQEEAQKLKERQEHQNKVREEMKKANEELERFKEIQKEEERIADMRIQKFMKDKMEREMAREEELAAIKNAKEREIGRLRAQQQKTQDKQALVDDMNALRIQEEVERKWRMKEMEEARKRKEQQESLMQAREKQIDDLRRAAAMRLTQDEQDFHKIAKIQKEQFDKEQEEKRKNKEKNERHRKELLKQINEKERERIKEQQEKFEEGKLNLLDDKKKDTYVKEHLKKKIAQLRRDQVPEHYVHEIEFQLNLEK